VGAGRSEASGQSSECSFEIIQDDVGTSPDKAVKAELKDSPSSEQPTSSTFELNHNLNQTEFLATHMAKLIHTVVAAR